MEPPTEPIAQTDTEPVFIPPQLPRKPTLESAMGPFSHTQFRFTTGLRAGDVAPVRSARDEVILTYRSFASIVGVVAALVSGIVAVAGLAAALFLVAEKSPFRAVVALVLTMAFTFIISLLAPRANVTLYDEDRPALTVAQRSAFPAATYVVAAPNGARLADLHKSFLSRLGRNRWTIRSEGRYLGEAVEESFPGALLRKALGKFSRSFETNIRITHGGVEAARILRRPDPGGRVDVLDVTNDALDRRVLVALATLILGSEP